MINLINEIRWRDKKTKSKLHEGPAMPKIGEDIYIPGSMYIDHGEDDIAGGLGEVIWAQGNLVTVAELPSTRYSWSPGLYEQQEKLKKEYGSQRAHPDPDYG